jgi:sodium transport system permease protein
MTPLFLVAMPLAMVALLPNIEIGYALALVPVSNVVLLVKAMLGGGEEIGPAIVAALATAVYALLALRAAVSIFKRESVLFRTGSGKSFDAVGLRASRAGVPAEGAAIGLYFAVLALMFFLAGSKAPATAGQAIRGFLVGQLVAVLAPAVLLARLLKVNVRRTFALRGFRPLLVPVLVAAAFAGLALVLGFYAHVMPQAEQPEGFEQVIEMLASFPPWLFFVLLAVVPPVCEELLCRGFLFAGLRPRLGAWKTVVVTAALFAALHLSLPRFPATFAAGLLLGYIRLRTGSVLACILFHMCWNGVPALAGSMPWIGGVVESLGPVSLAVLAAVLAASLAFLHRTATPADEFDKE